MSNDKPRLVKLTQEEANEILSAVDRGDMSYPYIMGKDGAWYGYADELRAWRASQHTSGEAK